MVGVISETQAAIGCAGRHKLPTGPPQMGQYPSVTEVAPPLGEADRQVKQELNKQIRGSREIERPAATSPSKEAPMGADDGWAMRTVRRDEGTDPLEPPGVPRYQQLPRMAASVERGMVVPPSALLKKRSRMRSVVHVFPKADAQLVILCSWVSQLAQRLKAHTSGEDAQAQLVTLGHERQPSGLPTARLRVMTSVAKITVALAPPRFASVQPPRLPRTKHELERFMGRLKKSRRPITGRKTPHACLLREGTFVALRLGRPPPDSWVDACSRVNPHEFQHHLHLVRHIDTRRTCGPVRRQ